MTANENLIGKLIDERDEHAPNENLINLVDAEHLGANAFFDFYVARLSEEDGDWWGVMMRRKDGFPLLCPLALGKTQKDARERMTVLVTGCDLGGFWSAEQVENFDLLAALVAKSGPQFLSRPLVAHVQQMPDATVGECQMCSERCWVRDFEPPELPAGVTAACTRCAILKGAGR